MYSVRPFNDLARECTKDVLEVKNKVHKVLASARKGEKPRFLLRDTVWTKHTCESEDETFYMFESVENPCTFLAFSEEDNYYGIQVYEMEGGSAPPKHLKWSIIFETKDTTDPLISVIKAVGVGVVTAGAISVALPSALAAVGFGTGGVVASSVAASVQSVVYGAWTTGVFSTCQSIGATQVVPLAVSATGGACASVVTGAASLISSK